MFNLLSLGQNGLMAVMNFKTKGTNKWRIIQEFQKWSNLNKWVNQGYKYGQFCAYKIVHSEKSVKTQNRRRNAIERISKLAFDI